MEAARKALKQREKELQAALAECESAGVERKKLEVQRAELVEVLKGEQAWGRAGEWLAFAFGLGSLLAYLRLKL